MVVEILIAVFGFILTILGTVLILQFKDMKTSVKNMSENIASLNVEIAKVIKDQSWHKKEVDEIKMRISILENKGE